MTMFLGWDAGLPLFRQRANPPASKVLWKPDPGWLELRDLVWEKSEGFCHLCGLQMFRGWKKGKKLQFHVEHIIPKSLGGTDHIDNLNGAHELCNYSKRAMKTITPEWREARAKEIQELLDSIDGS